MDIIKFKPYLLFIASCVLFLILVTYSLIIFVNWNKDLGKKSSGIEVSLPILDLQRYTHLSKNMEK